MALLVALAAGATYAFTAAWTGPEANPGVGREVSASAADEVPEAATEDAGEPGLPPHLIAQTPDHLEPGSGDSPTESVQHSARSAIPVSAAVTPSTTAEATTTTTTSPTSPTTTTTTMTPTTTLPAKKLDDGKPVAADDEFVISANTIVSLRVLENDTDPDGDINTATIALISDPIHAQRFGLVGNYFRYRSHPATNSQYSSEDSFVYEVCDETGLCATATVTLIIDAG